MMSLNFLLLLLGACAIADAMQDEKDKWKFDICKCISNKPKVCTPGSTEKKDCNECTCSNEGTVWSCTKKGCPNPICVPNSTKKQDCNDCTCAKDGTEWKCTDTKCQPEPKCKLGDTRLDVIDEYNCMACACNDESVGYKCNPTDCPEVIYCRVGDTWVESIDVPQGCQRCTCPNNGYGNTCTLVPCEPQPICKLGDYYIKANSNNAGDICKVCGCNDEAAGHEFYDCIDETCGDRQCSPGYSWIYEPFAETCLNCTCAAIGFGWACKNVSCL